MLLQEEGIGKLVFSSRLMEEGTFICILDIEYDFLVILFFPSEFEGVFFKLTFLLVASSLF